MYLIFALLAFSVLVIGHELGHFALAKLNGVKVEEFSVGMGPKIFGFKGKETEYSLKALPIGGYVRMYGEEEESDDERAFSNKTPKQRLSIIAAGPLMNLIMAIAFFAIIASANGFVVPTVSEVQKNSPAEAAGIQKGDKIIKIGDKKISTWEEFTTEVYAANANLKDNKVNPINITLERDGAVKPSINITPIKNEAENRYIIGIGGTLVEKPGVLMSAKYGIDQSISLVKQVFKTFESLFKGKLSYNDVGGPVTILKVSTKAAETGMWNLLWLCAFLSVQLAVFNIIPFPALDGGWIFLLLFEIITRKKVDQKKVAIVNFIGFSLLMALMVVVTLKDIFLPINLN